MLYNIYQQWDSSIAFFCSFENKLLFVFDRHILFFFFFNFVKTEIFVFFFALLDHPTDLMGNFFTGIGLLFKLVRETCQRILVFFFILDFLLFFLCQVTKCYAFGAVSRLKQLQQTHKFCMQIG